MVREPRKKKKGALESENALNLPLDLTRSYLAIPYDVSRHQVAGAYFFDGFLINRRFRMVSSRKVLILKVGATVERIDDLYLVTKKLIFGAGVCANAV
jgi:hypothetical protein